MPAPDITVGLSVEAQTQTAEQRLRALGTAFESSLKSFDGAVKSFSGALSSFEGTLQRTTSAGQTANRSWVDIAKGVLGGVSAFALLDGAIRTTWGALQSFVGGSIAFNASLEQSTKQFTTLIGNADEAEEHVRGLFDFAAHTPFESGEIIAASKALRSAGGAALDTRENLTKLGDAAAATGAPINEISRWIGRAYADLQAGRPFGEAAQRLTELNVITPKTRIQLENMLKATKDGPRVFNELIGSLDKFGGAMKEQESTWQGLTSTFQDTINNLSATTFRPLFDVLKELLATTNQFLSSTEVQKWAEDTAKWLGENLRSAIKQAREIVLALIQTIRDLAPAFTVAKNVIVTMVTVATDFVRAFNALPGPVKAVGIALVGIATAGPGVFDALNKVSGGAFGVYEKLTLAQRATSATNLLITAMIPGLQLWGSMFRSIGPAIGTAIASSGLFEGALVRLRAVILATQINISAMAISTFPALTRATGVVAAANDFLAASFARLKVAMSFLLAGAVVVGALAALGFGLYKVAQATEGAWQAWRNGKLTEYLSAKDSDNWVRRWLGLAGSIEKVSDATNDAFKSMRDEIAGITGAKEIADLQKIFLDLNASGELSTSAMRKLGERAKALAADGQKLTPELQGIVNNLALLSPKAEDAGGALDQFTGKTGKADKALKSWVDTFRDATSSMNTLSGAQVEGIRFFLALGQSVSETAKIMGVFEKQVEDVKALDGFNERLAEANSGLRTLSATQVEAIRYWLAQGASIEDVAKIQGVYAQEVTAVKEADENLVKARKAELSITRGLGTALKELGDVRETEIAGLKRNSDQVGELSKKWLGLYRDLSSMSPFDRQRAELEDWINDEEGKIDYSVGNWIEAYNKIHDVAALTYEKIGRDEKKALEEQRRNATDKLLQLGQAFANLSEIAGTGLGKLFTGIASVITSFGAARKSVDLMTDGLDTFLGRNGKLKDTTSGILEIGSAVLSAVAAFQSATNSASKLQNAIGGMMSGMEIGKGLGSLVGSIFGPVGAMLGGEIGKWGGAIIGGLYGLFHKPQWKRIMEDVGRDYGIDISEGLAKQIEADAKKIGDRTAATLKNLPAIIQEAGGINAKNVDMFSQKTRDLFVMVQRGLISVADASKAIGEVFPALAKQVTDSNGLASKSFIDLIALDKQFGTNVKEIADFVKEQYDNVIIPGLNGFADAHKSAMAKYLDDEKAVRDLVDKLRTTSDAKERADLQRQIDERTRARQADEAALNATTIQTQTAATGITAAIAATFEQLRSEGKTTREALKILAPTIDDIAGQLAKTGLSGTAAFNEIVDLAKAANDPLVSGVLDPLESITNVMKGLQNTGGLTDEMFQGLAAQAGTAMQTLEAAGKGGEQALRLMQPTLQLLWQEEQEFGRKADDATQALIDQAAAAGIVGEKRKSTDQQIADSTKRIADAVTAMAKAMGIDVPAAADAMATGVEAGASRADTALGGSKKTVADFVNQLKTSPEAYAILQQAAEATGGTIETVFDRQVLSKLKDMAGKLDGSPQSWELFRKAAYDAAQSAADAVENGPTRKIDYLNGELTASPQAWAILDQAARGSGGTIETVFSQQVLAKLAELANGLDNSPASWDKFRQAAEGAASKAGLAVDTRASVAVDNFTSKITDGGPWARLMANAAGATGDVKGKFGQVQSSIDTMLGKIDGSKRVFSDWSDSASYAVRRVTSEVNALNFGRSPGGLKEFKPFLSNAINLFTAFRSAGTRAASDVKRSVDDLSGAGWSLPTAQSKPYTGVASMLAAASTTADYVPPVVAPTKNQSPITVEQHFSFQVDATDAGSFTDRIDNEIAPRVMHAARLNIADTGTLLNELLKGR